MHDTYPVLLYLLHTYPHANLCVGMCPTRQPPQAFADRLITTQADSHPHLARGIAFQVAQISNDNAADATELSALESLDPIKSTDGEWMIFKVHNLLTAACVLCWLECDFCLCVKPVVWCMVYGLHASVCFILCGFTTTFFCCRTSHNTRPMNNEMKKNSASASTSHSPPPPCIQTPSPTPHPSFFNPLPPTPPPLRTDTARF